MNAFDFITATRKLEEAKARWGTLWLDCDPGDEVDLPYEWVEDALNGELVAGSVTPYKKYLTAWPVEANMPPIEDRFDAIVAKADGTFIYLYELQK